MASKRPKSDNVKIDISWEKLDGMLLFDASCRACAHYLDVSTNTIERRIKEKHGVGFTEYKRGILDQTVLRLKQTMIKKALKGDNTCLIFTLKNLSDWADKKEFENDLKRISISIRQEDKGL